MLVPTPFALGPDETVFEPATAQVGIECFAYEPWQARTLLGHCVGERLNVLLDRLVEHRVFGAMNVQAESEQDYFAKKPSCVHP